MRDASFLKTSQEFNHPLLARTYNSRSLWNGVFGFGWCSRFERKLQWLNANEAVLHQCDRKISIRPRKQKGLWVYQTPEGPELYDDFGRLVSFTKPNSQLSYDLEGRLSKIHSNGEDYSLLYEPSTGKVREIKSRHSGSALYQYRNGDLISVTASGQSSIWQYDDFHNLTEIQEAKGKEWISYQGDTDEIRTYQASGQACELSFEFQRLSSWQLKSTVDLNCPEGRQRLRTYQFSMESKKKDSNAKSSLP